MRYFLALGLSIFFSCTALAEEWEDRQVYREGAGSRTLRILSSTDTAYLDHVILRFLQTQRDIEIEYLVSTTGEIYDLVRTAPDRFDIVISSAMDLQIKLVNDGFAMPLIQLGSPDWTHWRHSLFGFTAEPAAIVVNKDAFDGQVLPKTRQDLIQLLRSDPDRFWGRIATYDIRSSGLGYLFATQDARTSETYWRLTEVMGRLATQLYCCSGEMISAVSRGDALVAYNVLGSYAKTQAQTNDQIEVIIPQDFATTMMRTAFVTRGSSQPQLAAELVLFLIAHFSQDQTQTAETFPHLGRAGVEETRGLIPLEPALMIYLDRLKKQAFTQEWESAIIQ